MTDLRSDTLRTSGSLIGAHTSASRLPGFCRVIAHPSFASAAALGVALSCSDPIAAVGLGPVTQQSSLGQSLRVVVPVLVSPGEDIDAQCFRLAASEREVEGVPQLVFGRMSLERTVDGARLVITNAASVNEPIVRMTVQAGCDTAVRREYVLLMDPPAVETPVVAADTTPRTEMAQAVETTPNAPPARRARASGRATTGSAASGTGESARATRKAPPPPRARAPAKSAPKRAPPSNQPRLTVSSAAPVASADPRATNALPERTQQELADALEAETVVLQRRIVELTAMVERMQQELQAAEAAQRVAADDAAKPAPAAPPDPAPAGTWSDQNWPLLAAIASVPLLLALALIWWRRAQREKIARWSPPRVAAFANTGPITQVAPFPGVPTPPAAGAPLPKTEAPPTGPKVAPPPPKKAPKRASSTRDSSALAVSELLHVTEEARVFVALGHPERAIDVLSEHVGQHPKSVPAAWLMLLDLYHATGREQEFQRVAEGFHVHCNVQAPLWEGFGSKREYEEGGLETFPHILREVTRLWRQPDCREYLERLLYENRDGRRMGFPLAAYGEILLLLQILDAPPVVDIDSDLVKEGKLDRIPRPPTASTSTGKAAAPTMRVAHTGTAAIARNPAQRPLDLEPERSAAEVRPARKLSS